MRPASVLSLTVLVFVGLPLHAALPAAGHVVARRAPPLPTRAERHAPCAGRPASLVVDTRARMLLLCDGTSGAPQASFAVALGTGGVGKRRLGDNRTPLGVYPLGPPRPSRHFGTFIPVGYPTPQQTRLGFTGRAVGLHGPPRDSVAAGAANTAADWTAGCIAVGTDAEIQRIASWVRARRRVPIVIE